MWRELNVLSAVIPGDLAPSVPSSGVPSVPNEESVDVRAGCDTLCEKLEATRKELTQMSKVSEVNFRLSTVSMVDPSNRDLHQIDVVEESETTGQTTGIPSPDSQTFKPSTKTVATDTDDLATFFTGEIAATLTEPVTEAVDMVEVENFEGKGEEVKEVKEPSEVTQQEAEVEEVECQGTQEAHEREAPQRKRCELPEGPGSARQYGREKNIPTEKAPEGSEKSRSTSTVRVQITNRNSNPRLRPNSRSRDSESKERRDSSSRPRMATQLHIPVSARLSSRRGNKVEQGLEKSFSARELSRYLTARRQAHSTQWWFNHQSLPNTITTLIYMNSRHLFMCGNTPLRTATATKGCFGDCGCCSPGGISRDRLGIQLDGL